MSVTELSSCGSGGWRAAGRQLIQAINQQQGVWY